MLLPVLSSKIHWNHSGKERVEGWGEHSPRPKSVLAWPSCLKGSCKEDGERVFIRALEASD